MAWVVVIARMTPVGVALDAEGPASWQACDAERRRLLNERAQEIADGTYQVQVIRTRNERIMK